MIIFSEKGRGSQTYVEGLVVAGLTVLFGIFLFVLYFGSKLPIFLGRDVVIVISVIICTVIATELSTIYRKKTPWYVLNRLIPSSILDWIFQPVKKNSGVLKRLLRLMQYVAYEWIDFSSFRVKLDNILIEYSKKYVEQFSSSRK